ncbi:polyhydroxyalkanoate synthesis repressor PhaR [Breoghania sp. L-A4]|uniref:polyhydroxyalkanoate synthesis repressor PhaR n=1 Tax=Breoghania sp. L-A4 TaxID=2304600 RepID=UPI000E35C81A|nr:polyhydroxyalkanoate synthesis repressor PhaR [Breoghania sp. L-A4]AXS42337.1 polyhydroxyalkanoate synthesis repressor PhaR [Breoghania sp. L-A4]
MTKKDEPTTIKKYANRRLYNTGTSTYVTLEDLADMVKQGESFVVYDAKSGDDITRSVLTQIIFEQEAKGQNLLPVEFLRQLIGFYGNSMQNIVPSFLEFSISTLTKDQEKLREQMSQTIGTTTFGAIEDQVRRNTEMFERAMRMFSPFATGEDADDGESKTAAASRPASDKDLGDLKQQLADMQKKIEALARDKD